MKPENIEAIERNIQSTMGRANLAGLGFGVVQNGELVYGKGFGYANLEAGEPVTPETVFRIASISKAVTAVGVMQLWEQNQFSLVDPINQHLTSFKIYPRLPSDPPVTIFHLLTHTAGLGELAPLLSYLHPETRLGTGVVGKEPLPLGRFYGRSFGRRLQPDSPPGVKWAYANHGFATLGQLIADVSGQSFASYMRDQMFAPLGMEKSDFLRRPRVQDGLATGYSKKRSTGILKYLQSAQDTRSLMGGATAEDKNLSPVWPDVEIITQADGSLFTTVNDFGKWVAALMDGRILKPPTLDLMWQPHFQLDERLPGMGLGFFYENWGGQRIVSHDGAWLGFNSSMWLAPEQKLAVFAFTNTNGTASIGLAKSIFSSLIGAPPPTAAIPTNLTPTPELWPELEGEYTPYPGLNSNLRLWLGYGAKLTVAAEGENLMIRSGRWWTFWNRNSGWHKGYALSRYDAADPLAFHISGLPVIFKRNAAGVVDRLVMSHQTFYKRG